MRKGLASWHESGKMNAEKRDLTADEVETVKRKCPGYVVNWSILKMP